MRLRWWVIGAGVLAVVSFGGLYYLVTRTWPDPANVLATPQLLFFALMFVGLSAIVIPVAAYLNYRFAKPGWLERDRTRLVRQGCWAGLLGVFLAYLQAVRTLTPTIATALAAAFILIELFFLTRE